MANPLHADRLAGAYPVGGLRAARPVDERWLSQAKSDELTLSRQLTFMTMTFAGEAAQLARVKAADGNYPLYGELITWPANLRQAVGEALVAPRLLALLGLKTGDSLEVGDVTLRVAGEVLREPDSGFNPFQTATGIIINTTDVEKTGAVQPGGRVTWHYLFAGEPEELERFENWLTPQLKADQRWNSPEESRGALNRSMERSQYFLLLSALLTLLLSVAAVAMGHYCRSRAELVAVLKTLGVGRLSLIKLIIGQWLALLAFSALCDALVGLGLEFEAVLIKLLAPVLPATLLAAGVWPWLWSMGSLVVISLLVGCAPIANCWPPARCASCAAMCYRPFGRCLLSAGSAGGAIGRCGVGALLLLRRLTLRPRGVTPGVFYQVVRARLTANSGRSINGARCGKRTGGRYRRSVDIYRRYPVV